MRTPEATIRKAMLHPDRLIRQEALHYFTESNSDHPTVMPLAIEAFKRFGRGNAFRYPHLISRLTQTAETVEWAIQELHRGPEEGKDADFDEAISRLLYKAALGLVRDRAEAIMLAPRFDTELAPSLGNRIHLATWTPDHCWAELERIAAQELADVPDIDYDFADRVVEALARQGQGYTERTLELLSRTDLDFETDPRAWMQYTLIRLAGEMRLEAAIPLIIRHLHRDIEGMSDICATALADIATDAVIEAVAAEWKAAAPEFQAYAGVVFTHIHSDAAVKTGLELLALKDLPEIYDVRTALADSLLGQFADEVIEPIREIVQSDDYDSAYADLKEKLVAVSSVMGVTFPEYAEWKKETEEERARRDLQRQKMTAIRFSPPLPPPPSTPPPSIWDRGSSDWVPPAPIHRDPDQVGRNDPCPCGSGKKYKKCCMKKD